MRIIEVLKLSKSFYVGKTVLKISKLVMYDVFYNTFLKEAFLRAM